MRCRRSLAVSAVSSRGRGRDARTLAEKVDGKDMLLGNVESQHRPATQLSTHANAFCERLIGSIRRECLDFLIPLNDRHLRGILKEWVAHYNKGSPHSGLGPGITEPSEGIPVLEISGQRIPCGQQVVGNSVLGGLHHEYRLEPVAA